VKIPRAGEQLIRVLSYLLVAGSLFVAMATGDRGGWRDVIHVVLYAEFFLAWAGVMLNAPIEGAKTVQEVLHGRLIVSGVCLVGGVVLTGVFLARGSLFGLIYGGAFVSHVYGAWRTDVDRTPVVLRATLSMFVLIGSFGASWALVGNHSQGPMLTGLIYFTVLPLLDVLLLSRLRKLQEVRHA
jgi:hypothetical protein